MPDRFIEQARAAFEPLAEAAGLEFEGQHEDEWFAWVRWSRDGITLCVSDDRRDHLIEVVIRRPMTDDDDRAALSQLTRGTDLALPLWAVVESRGGMTDYDVGGDRRLERLPMYADAAQSYGMEFLADPRTSVDAVARVVRERNLESSEEGRKAKRFLP